MFARWENVSLGMDALLSQNRNECNMITWKLMLQSHFAFFFLTFAHQKNVSWGMDELFLKTEVNVTWSYVLNLTLPSMTKYIDILNFKRRDKMKGCLDRQFILMDLSTDWDKCCSFPRLHGDPSDLAMCGQMSHCDYPDTRGCSNPALLR